MTDHTSDSSRQSVAEVSRRLLDKYVAVWLWSILFGTSTGLLYSFSSFTYRNWGSLALLLLPLAILAVLAVLYSWFALYKCLKQHILPAFFPADHQAIGPSPEGSDALGWTDYPRPDPKSAPQFRSTLSFQLLTSLRFLILATILRALISLVELLLSAAGNG